MNFDTFLILYCAFLGPIFGFIHGLRHKSLDVFEMTLGGLIFSPIVLFILIAEWNDKSY